MRVTLAQSHAEAADGIVPRQAGDIDRCLRAVDSPEKITQVVGGIAAVTRHHAGDAVMDIIICSWPLKNAAFDMGVHINEPGTDQQPFRVDGAHGLHILQSADPQDFSIEDRHVAVVPAVARAIYDLSVTDDQVGLLRVACRGNKESDGREPQSHYRGKSVSGHALRYKKAGLYLHAMLRLASEQDFDFLYGLYMHPVVNRWLLYEMMAPDAFRPIAAELLQRNTLYVFEQDGVRAAMCKLVPQKYRNSHIVYLGGVAVDPARQGQGIGAKMLASAINLCRARSFTRIELTVSVENPKAIRLYENLGFLREGILKNYCYLAQEGRYMDEQVMALLLD